MRAIQRRRDFCLDLHGSDLQLRAGFGVVGDHLRGQSPCLPDCLSAEPKIAPIENGPQIDHRNPVNGANERRRT